MDLKQLTALVTVADVGSVTRAAVLLHLVQPAVTRQIRALEDEFGVEFFTRTRQGMVITPAGELMVARARRALQELERARSEIQPTTDLVTGTVSVGLLESAIGILLEPLAGIVSQRYPGVQLRVLTAYSGHLQEWLDDGDLDVSLLYDVDGSTPLMTVPLLSESVWVVGGSGAGLTVQEPVSWDQLRTQPLVLPIAGHGLRALIDKGRPADWGEPDVACETNSMEMQKQLVMSSSAWTILPAVGVAREVASARLTAAPLRDPELTRSVVLAQHRRRRPPRSVQVVARELRALIQRLVLDGTWPSAHLSPTLE